MNALINVNIEQGKNCKGFYFPKYYGKICSVPPEIYVQHKPLISEE